MLIAKLKVTRGQVFVAMLDNLKQRLDSGEIIIAYGADRPGEYAVYCSSKTWDEGFRKFNELVDLEDNFEISTPEQLAEETGVNPSDKYIHLRKDWNDTGDLYCASSNDITGIDADCRYYCKVNLMMVNRGIITLDQVEFEDSNSEFGENLSYVDDIPEDAWE